VYDHALVLRKDSRFLPVLNNEINERLILTDYQPTCENLLIAFVDIIQEKLESFPGVELHSVRLRETQTSFAEWFASDN
jgi:6-pyruvoyltetrahydropterin/6-carboxytetrahydropterin synthase